MCSGAQRSAPPVTPRLLRNPPTSSGLHAAARRVIQCHRRAGGAARLLSLACRTQPRRTPPPKRVGASATPALQARATPRATPAQKEQQLRRATAHAQPHYSAPCTRARSACRPGAATRSSAQRAGAAAAKSASSHRRFVVLCHGRAPGCVHAAAAHQLRAAAAAARRTAGAARGAAGAERTTRCELSSAALERAAFLVPGGRPDD
jgi:hypothetical protein